MTICCSCSLIPAFWPPGPVGLDMPGNIAIVSAARVTQHDAGVVVSEQNEAALRRPGKIQTKNDYGDDANLIDRSLPAIEDQNQSFQDFFARKLCRHSSNRTRSSGPKTLSLPYIRQAARGWPWPLFQEHYGGTICAYGRSCNIGRRRPRCIPGTSESHSVIHDLSSSMIRGTSPYGCLIMMASASRRVSAGSVITLNALKCASTAPERESEDPCDILLKSSKCCCVETLIQMPSAHPVVRASQPAGQSTLAQVPLCKVRLPSVYLFLYRLECCRKM